MIDGILDYSKLGKSNISYERIDVNEVLLKIMHNREDELSEVRAEVKFLNLPCVMGDRFRVEQVFENLIANSLKFRRNGVAPIIEVFASETCQGQLNINFKDNGIGFDMEYAEKIFDPFQRLDDINDKFGSGLGLSICKKILLAHGGDIVAEGELNEGAKFIMTFPIKA